MSRNYGSGRRQPWVRHASYRLAACHFPQNGAQVSGKLVAVLVACLRALADRKRHDIGQALGQLLADDANVRRLFIRNLVHQLGHGLTAKRQYAGEHLEQHDTERIEVGTPIHLFARELLGRHETGRSKDQPRLRLARVGNARNAKVRYLDRVAVQLVHDVGGLDITVHHVLLVRIRQSLRHAGHD